MNNFMTFDASECSDAVMKIAVSKLIDEIEKIAIHVPESDEDFPAPSKIAVDNAIAFVEQLKWPYAIPDVFMIANDGGVIVEWINPHNQLLTELLKKEISDVQIRRIGSCTLSFHWDEHEKRVLR